MAISVGVSRQSVGIKVVSPLGNRISINAPGRPPEGGSGNGVSYLSQLHDVDASDANTNETLIYDAANNKYIVQVIPSVEGGLF